MKKILLILKIGIIIFVLGSFLPYNYNNDKVINYINKFSNNKSKCMCALYVMNALRYGGCYPCGIYPAYAYSERLISLGFEEVSIENYNPVKGDIIVLSQNSKSIFGHIAIYNGNQWISDFKQSNMYPSNTYRKESNYQIFRQSDGLHLANIWFSPCKLIEYIKVFINGFHKINFLVCPTT